MYILQDWSLQGDREKRRQSSNIWQNVTVSVHSRRGDLEILGYNLVQWLSGKLPWEGNTDPEQVKAAKTQAMNNITAFLNNCFKPDHPPGKISCCPRCYC